MATLPLNIASLLKEIQEESVRDILNRKWSMPDGVKIGHIHLHVSSLEKAEEFYHHILGFDVTMRTYPGALFMSAGGYHHHIGVNIWAGVNAPPTLRECVQLKSFSIKLSKAEKLREMVNNLRRHNCSIKGSLVNKVKNYVGVTVEDFDGNSVEIVVEKGLL